MSPRCALNPTQAQTALAGKSEIDGSTLLRVNQLDKLHHKSSFTDKISVISIISKMNKRILSELIGRTNIL